MIEIKRQFVNLIGYKEVNRILSQNDIVRFADGDVFYSKWKKVLRVSTIEIVFGGTDIKGDDIAIAGIIYSQEIDKWWVCENDTPERRINLFNTYKDVVRELNRLQNIILNTDCEGWYADISHKQMIYI